MTLAPRSLVIVAVAVLSALAAGALLPLARDRPVVPVATRAAPIAPVAQAPHVAPPTRIPAAEPVPALLEVTAAATCGEWIVAAVGPWLRAATGEGPWAPDRRVDLRSGSRHGFGRVDAIACTLDAAFVLTTSSGDPLVELIVVAGLAGPGDPAQAGSAETPVPGPLVHGVDVELDGGIAWVTTIDPGRLHAVDVASGSPAVIGSIELPEAFAWSGLAPRLAIGADRAFVAMNGGVAVIDIADPRALRLVGEVAAPGDPNLDEPFADAIDVSVVGGSLAVTSSEGVCIQALGEAREATDRHVAACLHLGPGSWRVAGWHADRPTLFTSLLEPGTDRRQGIAYAVIADDAAPDARVSVSRWLPARRMATVRMLGQRLVGVTEAGVVPVE